MTPQAAAFPTRSWLDSIADFLASVGEQSEVGRRAAAAERLYALSDEELAGKGLSRDRVLHHAFGPYLSV